MDAKKAEFALDQGRRIVKAKEKLPSLSDYRDELPAGSVQVQVDEDGQCNGQIVGHEAVARMMEMQCDWRRDEIERSAILNAEVPTETTRNAAGEIHETAATCVDALARKGAIRPVFKRKPHWVARYERGQDGGVTREVTVDRSPGGPA